MESEDEAAAVGEIEADADVGGEVGDGFAHCVIGLCRLRILGMWIARHFARVGKRAAAGGQDPPYVLEPDREGGGGAAKAADGGDRPFQTYGEDEEVVGHATQWSEE